MDYRATLNLPKTDFPMRANAAKREPERLATWGEGRLYERMLENRAEAPLFVLHDGPPYANGLMHLGHVMNRVLKDLVVKYRTMAGYRAPFTPGWDCHGLPIELQVEKEIGRKKKAELSAVEVRRLCADYAMKFVGLQREGIERLGVVGDFQNPYLTLTPAYEAQEIRELGKLAASGALYRKKKPVYWCSSCATALAEAEVEYKDKRSPSIWIRYRVYDREAMARSATGEGQEILAACEKVSLVAWTTTPWTLPASLAISLNPALDYVALSVEDEIFVVAAGLAERFLTQADLAENAGSERIAVDPNKLEKMQLDHPWLDRKVPVLLGDHVTLESGTGVVHTAPGHGQEDYEIGLRYGIDAYSPVSSFGCFTDEVPEFAGVKIRDADPLVIETLGKAGTLVAQATLEHSFPHCWRCRKPLFFRATEQWFVSMEHEDLRTKALAEIEEVQWIPDWGRARIRGMVEGRPDWCISRQRSWGVPIVAVHCEDCGESHLDGAMAEHVADIVETEGSDAWWARPLAELLPPGFVCPSCQSTKLVKENDILDVWFDSGVSHASVLEKKDSLRAPADLYLEGSDQHRGWFHTSLLTSVANRGRAPYKACLTHGFLLDGKGRKMSKSVGNMIAPDKIIKKFGADILRLWVAAEDYRGDVSFSDEILGHLVEAYRRLRNTSRFLLGNLGDFDPAVHTVDYAELPELERWALDRLSRALERSRDGYETYEFHTVYHLLNNYCATDLSARYLDVVKDRLYCSAPDDAERRAAQTVMYEIVRGLVGMAAPILSFLADDVWSSLVHREGDPESALLLDFPVAPEAWRDDELAATFERLLAVRAAATKAIETERRAGHLGHSLEAHVALSADGALGELLREHEAQLPELLIVSSVSLETDLPESDLCAGLGVTVRRTSGEKCERCWIYRDDVGAEASFREVCGRCADVLGRIELPAEADGEPDAS
ncbi:MAG: isoleucine--tRNA ligase [bacterium]